MMGSNNGGGGGGGGMAPGMGSPMGAGGSDGWHDDEAVLTEFLSSLMDYTPTIPDELVEHYLGRSGFHCPDVRLTRLVAVATQKFISDIASDSLQHCKARVAAPIKDNKSKQPKDRRLVLTMDDLSKALREVHKVMFHHRYHDGLERFLPIEPRLSHHHSAPRQGHHRTNRRSNSCTNKTEDGICNSSRKRQGEIVEDMKRFLEEEKDIEILEKILNKHGVNLKHPEYFADSPSAGMAPSTREEQN